MKGELMSEEIRHIATNIRQAIKEATRLSAEKDTPFNIYQPEGEDVYIILDAAVPPTIIDVFVMSVEPPKNVL